MGFPGCKFKVGSQPAGEDAAPRPTRPRDRR